MIAIIIIVVATVLVVVFLSSEPEKQTVNTEHLEYIEKIKNKLNEDISLEPVTPTKYYNLNNETCYFFLENVGYYENKEKTVIIGGLSYRKSLGYGLNINLNNNRRLKVNTVELKDKGTLLLTDKSIFIDGVKSNYQIKYSNILSIGFNQNSLIIERKKGKDIIIECTYDVEELLIAKYLEFLLQKK